MAALNNEKLLAKIRKSMAINEKEINLIKRRLNDGKLRIRDIDFLSDGDVIVGKQQYSKGIKWLKNLYITPTGKMRKNNPFGRREIDVLESAKYIEVIGFENVSFWSKFYVPHYSVVGYEGSFDYYVNGGKVVITG